MSSENPSEPDKIFDPLIADLEKSRQMNKELTEKLNDLESENLKLTEERAPWRELSDSFQHFLEEFSAFQQSYAYDIDKLISLLLDVQNTLGRGQTAGWWHRLRTALNRKNRATDKPGTQHY